MASSDLTPPHVYEQPYPAFDINAIGTPAYVVDVALLRKNMEKLAAVQSESGAKVLLALKGFSMFSVFPIMREYLSGCCASGLNEALLAQEFGKEVHVYAPAFKEAEMRQIIPIAHHISFNSLAQFRKFKPMLDAAKAAGHAPSPGIRVNPEHSEVEVSLYDPCSPGCRLGIRAEALEGEDLTGIEGLHFHALCEQDSDVLERTVAAVEKRFPRLLEQVQWVNMGGGHHITRKDYDVERLIRVLRSFREKWGKEVYIEPGEAAGLNTGYLVTEVQDIVGAPKTTVVVPKTANNLSHDQETARPFAYRTPEDARSAARALCGSIHAALGRLDHPDEAQRLITEAESLFQWAAQNGWLVAEDSVIALVENLESFEGGFEHDVFAHEAAGRALKLTQPPNFGGRGAAVSYLENILACDHLFGLDWRFEGVVKTSKGLRLLSSQPFIVGRNALEEEIVTYFESFGFQRSGTNKFANAAGVTIADARAANVFVDAHGRVFPIDVHVLGITLEDIASETLPEESNESACDVLPTAILDLSATAHMPDCLEMPYRPRIFGAGLPGEFPHEYKMGGMSCLAGDVLTGFSFPEPLKIGQRLVFADMAHYTMVKTTTFNGVPHPDIAIYDPATQEYLVVRRFGYADFKNKLS